MQKGILKGKILQIIGFHLPFPLDPGTMQKGILKGKILQIIGFHLPFPFRTLEPCKKGF
jgi:hypothetical protein